MGLPREIEAALIGLGIGSGVIAIGVFCWWLVRFFRLCNHNGKASSDKKLSPKEEEEEREHPTEQSPEGPLEITEAKSPLPPPRRSTTRTIAPVVAREKKASRSKNRNTDIEARIPRQPRKSNKGIRIKEKGFSKKVKWSDSVVDNQERKLIAEKSKLGGRARAGSGAVVDPFAMYDTEYKATYLRNETTAEADMVAGWKRKAFLEVQSGGGDEDDVFDDGNSVIASLPTSLKDEGRQATGHARGGFFPALSCFDCYVSSPQSAEL